MDSPRSSIRKVWQLSEYPGSFVVRLLVDLLVLIGLGLLLALPSPQRSPPPLWPTGWSTHGGELTGRQWEIHPAASRDIP